MPRASFHYYVPPPICPVLSAEQVANVLFAVRLQAFVSSLTKSPQGLLEALTNLLRDYDGFVFDPARPVSQTTGYLRPIHLPMKPLEEASEDWWEDHFGARPYVHNPIYVHPATVQRYRVIGTICLARFPRVIYPMLEGPANLNHAPRGRA